MIVINPKSSDLKLNKAIQAESGDPINQAT